MVQLTRKALKKTIPLCIPAIRSLVLNNPIEIPPKRVAYFISGGIGDALMAFPTAAWIQNEHPSLKLTVYVPKRLYTLCKSLHTPFLIRPIGSYLWLIISILINKDRYNVTLVNITSLFSLRVEFTAFFAGKISFGFHYPEETESNRLFTRAIEFNKTNHFANQNLSLAMLALGGNKENLKAKPFQHYQKNRKTNGVIIHPGSKKGYEYKRWPLVRYIELAKRVYSKGYTATFLIGPEDHQILSTACDIKEIDLLINPRPKELLTILDNASCFIGNDSGPAHIAAFKGVPAIVLFGPESPQRSAPLGDRVSILYNKRVCSPCQFIQTHCTSAECMLSITVDEVWDTFLQKEPTTQP